MKRAIFAASALLALAGCQKPAAQTGIARVAVLRFENLSPDPSLDWMGRAVSEAVFWQLSGTKDISAIRVPEQMTRVPGVSAEKAAAQLAGATHLVFGYYTELNGKTDWHLAEEDLRTQKVVMSMGASGDPLMVADQIARRISAHPRALGTAKTAALRSYSLAADSPAQEAKPLYQKAIEEDPNFGPAYVMLSRVEMAMNDRAGLEQLLKQAEASKLPAVERTSLLAESAGLRQDSAGRVQALGELARNSPADAEIWKALAEAEFAAHKLPESVQHYREALKLLPGRFELWNALAYAQMFAGDYTGALASAAEYEKLRPGEANPIDTAGDIHFYFQKYAEAEKSYLRAAEQDPTFIQGGEVSKAARARLMTGDVAGATQIFARYQADRKKATDPLLPFREAEWKYLTDGPKEAVRMMTAFGQSSQNKDIQSLAFSQAAIWALQEGARAEAQKFGDTALRTSRPETILTAALARFAAQEPASQEEWRHRAERQLNGANAAFVKNLALGYALTFSGKYAEAAPIWRQLAEQANPNEQSFGYLYALCLVKSGHPEEAKPWLKGRPLPPPGASASFESVYLPALFLRPLPNQGRSG